VVKALLSFTSTSSPTGSPFLLLSIRSSSEYFLPPPLAADDDFFLEEEEDFEDLAPFIDPVASRSHTPSSTILRGESSPNRHLHKSDAPMLLCRVATDSSLVKDMDEHGMEVADADEPIIWPGGCGCGGGIDELGLEGSLEVVEMTDDTTVSRQSLSTALKKHAWP